MAMATAVSQSGAESKAVSEVLNLPELLEQILRNLDILDLFTVQRVNKQFQAVVNRSKPIQHQMFLKMGPPTNVVANAMTVINPLLFHPAVGFEKCEIRIEESIDLATHDYKMEVKTFRDQMPLPHERPPFKTSSELSQSEYTSWRKTLLVASPCRIYGRVTITGHSLWIGDLKLEPGATLEELVNAVRNSPRRKLWTDNDPGLQYRKSVLLLKRMGEVKYDISLGRWDARWLGEVVWTSAAVFR